MISALFLIILFLIGFLISRLFLSSQKGLVLISSSFLLGSIFTISSIYILTAYIFEKLFFTLISLMFFLFIFVFLYRKKVLEIFSGFRFLTWRDVLIFFTLFIVSFNLFAKTFSYDGFSGEFLIASNIYSDFGSHVPFIRSFSLGENFPAEIPFFPGENILYHFMFDFYVGILEFMGLRIDFALNILSAISFTILLVLIYYVSHAIFKKTSIGLISVLLFLGNSSLSFINFFAGKKIDLSLISSFWHYSSFDLKGPLGENTIAVSLTINAFTNQRHLVFGMAVVLLLIYLFLSNKEKGYRWRIILGISIGFLPMWNLAMFLSAFILTSGAFVFLRKLRGRLFLIGIISLIVSAPFLIFFKSSSSQFAIVPGFIIYNKLTLPTFVIFWFWNLGILIIMFLLGFFTSSKNQIKFFLIFSSLFILANLFQFSKDIASNHKFLNLWLVLMNMYAAFTLVKFFKKGMIGKIFASILFVLLMLSGILNLQVVKNDVLTRIKDYPNNSLMSWMLYNIPNKSIILTTGEIYDPASILGKKVFLGRSYYVETYGGSPRVRLQDVDEFFHYIKDKNEALDFIKQNNIEYLVVYKNNFAKNQRKVDSDFFKSIFKTVYEDSFGVVLKG